MLNRQGGATRQFHALLTTASTNHPLFRHGEGLGFVGFGLGVFAFLMTRRGLKGAPPSGFGFNSGRYLAMYYLRWPLLVLGLVGAVMMIAAVM